MSTHEVPDILPWFNIALDNGRIERPVLPHATVGFRLPKEIITDLELEVGGYVLIEHSLFENVATLLHVIELVPLPDDEENMVIIFDSLYRAKLTHLDPKEGSIKKLASWEPIHDIAPSEEIFTTEKFQKQITQCMAFALLYLRMAGDDTSLTTKLMLGITELLLQREKLGSGLDNLAGNVVYHLSGEIADPAYVIYYHLLVSPNVVRRLGLLIMLLSYLIMTHVEDEPDDPEGEVPDDSTETGEDLSGLSEETRKRLEELEKRNKDQK